MKLPGRKSEKFTCGRRMDFPYADGGDQEPVDEWRKDGTCSYCGSISPKELFEAIDEGRELGPTDKNYKVYLDNPWGKFYFQHLSEEERKHFIELLNEKKIKIGYPGHFYRLPFFAVAQGAKS